MLFFHSREDVQSQELSAHLHPEPEGISEPLRLRMIALIRWQWSITVCLFPVSTKSQIVYKCRVLSSGHTTKWCWWAAKTPVRCYFSVNKVLQMHFIRALTYTIHCCFLLLTHEWRLIAATLGRLVRGTCGTNSRAEQHKHTSAAPSALLIEQAGPQSRCGLDLFLEFTHCVRDSAAGILWLPFFKCL